MTTTENLIQAVLTAPEDRKVLALKVLMGEAAVPAPKATEPFLTLKECAKRLGFTPCCLWRWKVPGHQLGGRPRFRMSEIEAYLESEEFKRRAEELRREDRERRKPMASSREAGVSSQ